MKRVATFLFVCTILDALQSVRPGAEWSITGDGQFNNYTLTWLDKTQVKPTASEIQAAINSCQSSQLATQQQIQADIANVKDSATTTQVKIQSLIDLMQLRKQL